jgi:hypothetical protein
MKHTPGPWNISWNTFNRGEMHGIYADGEMDLKGYQIAMVHYYPTMHDDANEETGNANARLIAAAPDLIKALIGACAIIGTHVNMKEWEGKKDKEMYIRFWNQIKTAIEKAEGKKEEINTLFIKRMQDDTNI